MRYAFMSFSCPDLDLHEMLALCRELGYTGIEPRIQSKHAHGIDVDMSAEARRETRQAFADAGVAMCCIATSCRYADPANAADMIEDTRRAIDLAGDLGCPRLRVFGGAIGEGLDRDAAVDQVAQSLALLAEQAAERDVVLALETHDDWCDPDHVAAIMRAVDHPAIAVNWDILHPLRVGKTMDQAHAALQPWIRHVHFHDSDLAEGKLRMVPIGEGVVDHRRAIELLQGDGYQGFMSGEWINWQPAMEHLPRELAAMRRLEADQNG